MQIKVFWNQITPSLLFREREETRYFKGSGLKNMANFYLEKKQKNSQSSRIFKIYNVPD